MTSSGAAPEAPGNWRVRLSSQLWKVTAGIGGSIISPLVVSVLSTWLKSAAFQAGTPLRWLADRWFIFLPIGICFLLLTLFLHFRRDSRRLALGATASPALDQENRAILLQRLGETYRKNLEPSFLEGEAPIKLSFILRPDAVQKMDPSFLDHPPCAEQVLPPGTLIQQVYKEAEQELLILGVPGAGKSTLLVQLALELVGQAERSDSQLIPVILPLATWAKKQQPLQEWFIEQVAQTYKYLPFPKGLAGELLQGHHFLPLLDGLDEMEEKARPACISEINRYIDFCHQQGRLVVPLVVCSRKAEYETAFSKHERLRLQRAVEVRTLTDDEVGAVLSQPGKALEALRRMLRRNPELREEARTPLMLSILQRTYRGTSGRSLSQKGTELQQRIWTDYVERMLKRRKRAQRWDDKQFRHWLSTLARHMNPESQPTFFVESLQPDWLSGKQKALYHLSVGLMGGLMGGLFLGGLVGWLMGGLFFGLLSALFIGLPGSQLIERLHLFPNKGIGRSVNYGLTIGLIIGLAMDVTTAALLFEEKGTRECFLSNS